MEALKKLVAVSCFLAVGISMLDMLCPEKKFEKQMRLIFSLFFLIGLAAPFLSGGGFSFEGFNLSEKSDFSSVQNSLKEDYKTAIEKNISSALLEKLKANGINADKISTNVNISDDNSISISEIEVELSDKGLEQKAFDVIKNEVGGDVRISINQRE